MKKTKFAHKAQSLDAAEPFGTAEEAWFWAMTEPSARNPEENP